MARKNTARVETNGESRSIPRVAKASDGDKLIHERNRLAIISSLAVSSSLSFTDLKSLHGLSDGNLSVHAQKLESAGYIRCKKTFEGRTPKTVYSITSAGRKALENYLSHMEQLIAMVRDRE